MNNVLTQILDTGTVVDRRGDSIPAHSGFNRNTGELLQKWLRESNCTNAVEVGLAFGISSLFIMDELTHDPDARLYGIDPMQHNEMWDGIGLENLKRAGFSQGYNFYNEPSHSALPKILETGTRFQFGLIDGWHTFDYAFVDFFFLDKLIDVNGVIVFDDVGYKSIHKLLTFVLTNMEYELVDCVEVDGFDRKKGTVKRRIKSALSRFSRDDWTPGKDAKRIFNDLRGIQAAAIRKKAEDSRRWDHFTVF